MAWKTLLSVVVYTTMVLTTQAQTTVSGVPDGTVMPAFSAGLTSMLNVTDKSDVIYDRVFLNMGNGYDSTTGVFTVPVDGTYLFMFHGLGESNGQLYLELYKNDLYVTSAYAHVTGNYAAASQVIVLEVVKGDRLHIRGHGDSIVYGDPHEVYTTFSGYVMFFKGTN